MSGAERLLEGIPIPKMICVHQKFDRAHIEAKDIPEAMIRALSSPYIKKRIYPGMRIAITAGSREICNIVSILASAVQFLKQCGADPFLVPAMGSHGGATAEGQVALLQGYGITERQCGCQILSSMETLPVGQTSDGQTVFLDRYAAQADGILIIGRVKAHTGFHGRYESGILKMMTVGLGKQAGADACHQKGFGSMAANLELFGRVVLQNVNIVGAVAILENAFDETHSLVGLGPEDILEEEPKLLEQSKALMPQIFLPACDVLVVDEIGKNISGAGMDPNVTGRNLSPECTGGLQSQQLAVLRLSPKTHGNGYGIGAADCTTEQVFRQLDLDAMYVNGLTCKGITPCRIPCVFRNDRLAIQACIKACESIGPDGPRVIRISNTLNVETIQISENYRREIAGDPRLEAQGEPFSLSFNQEGNLPI